MTMTMREKYNFEKIQKPNRLAQKVRSIRLYHNCLELYFTYQNYNNI